MSRGRSILVTLVLVILAACIVVTCATGCSSRDYTVSKHPDGSYDVRIKVRGTDSTLGSLEVESAQGSRLHLENYSQKDQAAQAYAPVMLELARKIPSLPVVPVP